MKTKKLFFNIFIFIALVKVSLLEAPDSISDIDFIAMGVDHYKDNKQNVTFGALFMKLNKTMIDKNFSVNAAITYLDNSNSNIDELEIGKTNCTINRQTDDYIYYNCYIEIGNIENITTINFTDWSKEVGESFGKKVELSFLMNDSNFNLLKWEKELYIFNLIKIEKNLTILY